MVDEKSSLIRVALPVGTVLKSAARSYRIEKVLGAGGFGITYLAVGEIDARYYAIKEHITKGCGRDSDGSTITVAPTSKDDFAAHRRDFENEADRLIELGGSSINIVKVYERFRANGTSYYVMEYLDGGSLLKYVKANGGKLSEKYALSIMIPVIRAVELLHSGDRRLLHLDIKPDNIVMKTRADGMVYPVLIDFGTAKHFDKKGHPTSRPISKGATTGYAPIEQYQPISDFDARLDVYALGATLYYMLIGKSPVSSFDLKSEMIEAALPAEITERTRRAVIDAMQRDKSVRTASCSELLHAIEEPHTLPIYHVLHGSHQNYRIMEVLEVRTYWIVYRAIPCYGDNVVVDNDMMPGNGTVANQHYRIYERFTLGYDERINGIGVKDADYINAGAPEYDENEIKFLVAGDARDMQEKLGHLYFEPHDQSYDIVDGIVNLDMFYANNTTYCVVNERNQCHGSVSGIWKYVVAGLLVCAIVVAGCMWWLSTCGQSDAEDAAERIEILPEEPEQPAAPVPMTAADAQTQSIKTSAVAEPEYQLLQVTPAESLVPAVTDPQPVEVSVDDAFTAALAASDWDAMERLASQGYSPAYYPLAKHLYNVGDRNCAAWARKAIDAGLNVSEAQLIIDQSL